MRNLIMCLLLVLFSTNLMAQKNTKAQLLENCLKELQESPKDSIKQRNFFNAFPANFPDLLVSMGYTSFSSPLPDPENYAAAFNDLTYISESEKMVRLSHVMIGGFWQADGVNYVRHIMETLMRKNADRALGIISQLTECQQILFWQSYWQNPCKDPSLEKDLKLFDAVHGYNHEKKTMKEAYESFNGELPIMF